LDQIIFPVSSGGRAPKKRYVGIYQKKDKKTGEMKKEYTIRGIEARRGDWSMIAKNTQMDVINMIFDGKDRYEILDYLHKVKTDLYAGKHNDKLSIHKSLKDGDYKANTPQLKAFKKLEEITKTKRFTRSVDYILVRNKDGVYPIGEEIVNVPDADYKAYWQRQILPPSMRFLSVLPDKKQTTLD